MPCWFYDKKELRNTPSFQNGIDANTEARYRREGARFIIDAGTKMGLRYDTCSTGVIYFHRFYMFHSFTEFHRYVIGASCLFLAGKVEETPKKCKDVVKICRTLLTDQQFSVFKDNPREEIMTSERILLQTLKFDLQVEHPYAHIVRLAKQIHGDKEKLQKVVQMAWTFINDSLCTTLCLQWESEIIAVSMLYLATRLSKFEITDWVGRVPGGKGKWWEALIEGLCQELIEDICHQCLDLYSSSNAQKGQESPPITSIASTQSPNADGNQSLTPKKDITDMSEAKNTQHPSPKQPVMITYSQPAAGVYSGPNYIPATYHSVAQTTQYSQHNPYVSSQMYSSSFMTGEASQSIQSLIHQDDSIGHTYGPGPPSQYPQGYQNQTLPHYAEPGYRKPYPGSYAAPMPIGGPSYPHNEPMATTGGYAQSSQYYRNYPHTSIQGPAPGLPTVRITGRQPRH